MSKIGKQPITIPEGVTVQVREDGEQTLVVVGKNATLKVPVLANIEVKIEENQIYFSPQNQSKQTVSNWGTMRALTANAVSGSIENFRKELIIEGVGFRANLEGKTLTLSLGFSHPVVFPVPEGVAVTVEKSTIKITGAGRALGGEVAAKSRSLKRPEPYLGKGIRYSDEIIRRKAGKKAVASGG